MPPATDLDLRDATAEDLPAIAALRESVGWAVHEWALRAVIGKPNARCLVVTDDGVVVGVGSGIVYGQLGFVGNMIVSAAHRRRGIGSAILDAVTTWLTEAGCTRLELNATSEGRPLYERHGFASIGRSATAKLPRDLRLDVDPATEVHAATADDLPPLATYDRPRFGGDRSDLLRYLLTDPDVRLLIARREASMVGYACVRADGSRIGPLVADDPPVAATLVAAAFDATEAREFRVNLPPNNHAGEAWLRGLGVAIEPWDGRMARGPQLPRREETIYGMTVGALG